MSRADHKGALAEPSDTQLEQATKWFLRVRSEAAQVEDLPALKDWLDADPLHKLAYQQVRATWSALGTLSSTPEVMLGRRDALDDAHKVYLRRWSVPKKVSRYIPLAASIIVAIVGALTWMHTQRGVYTTDVSERRTLTLEDGSVVTLDAKSRVRVQYEANQRVIALERGQARFDVAKDPTRPFRVNAGDQTVIALGTQFNVELVSGNVLVSMIEGHVAVTGIEAASAQPLQSLRLSQNDGSKAASAPPGSQPQARVETPGQIASLPPMVELKAGEGLRVRSNGQAVVLPKIDVDRATAWQSGKMYFDNEPLGNAAERINRYSTLQISVDPSVQGVNVNGIFNAGDSNAFVEAICTYFPVQVDRISGSKIRLTARQ